MEPFYIAQNADDLTIPEIREWVQARCREAHEQGATHLRASVDPERSPKIYLIEGWREKPDEEGQPRWQMTTVD